MIISKNTQLSRCDCDFLVTLAEKTNLSYRYHQSKDKSSLLQILCNKFDAETIDWIVKMYLLCNNAEDVAKTLLPKGMDTLVKAIPDFFGIKEVFYEVSVGKRICDAVLVKNKEVIAIEVKSASDKVTRAVKQTKYYSLWANRTYLVYDGKHSEKVKQLFEQQPNIGLLEYTQDKLILHRKASLNSLNFKNLLTFCSHKYIKKLARKLKINGKGKKLDISNRIVNNLTEDKIQEYFISFLKNKALTPNRATKRFDANDQTYHLKQFLGA